MELKELTIEVTQQCPNYCIHCSSLSSISKTCAMPLSKIIDTIDDASSLGCTQLSISGGEPFLRPDLTEIVAHAKRKNMLVSIYTSGIYHDGTKYLPLPLEILHELVQYNCKIIVNYEAADEVTYDLIMGTHIDGFNILKQSVKTCICLGFDVEAHTVPMCANYLQLKEIISQCMELGIKKVSFLRLVRQGRVKENESLTFLSDEQMEEVKNLIYTEQQKHPDGIRIGIPLSNCSDCLNCMAGTVKLNVRYDGKVFPCEAFKDNTSNKCFTYPPDTIYDNSLIEIYDNDVYLAEVRTMLDMYHSACRKEKCFNQYIRKNGKY